jgi:hypothetical protein
VLGSTLALTVAGRRKGTIKKVKSKSEA